MNHPIWPFFDRMRRTLREFLDHVRVLRRGTDFRFRFSGFPLTNVNVDQIDFGVQIFESFHADEDTSDEEDTFDVEYVFNEYAYSKNQQLIDPDDPLEFLTELDYMSLVSFGEIPSGFSEKLTCVQSVCAKRVPDAGQLLRFLKPLRSLRKLELKKRPFNQQLFDCLPTFARSLARLVLRKDSLTAELQLSFDFIARFSNLPRIEIEDQLSFDSFRSLAKHFGQLEWVSFRFGLNGGMFSVCTCNNIWLVNQADRCLFETEHPHKILSFFEGQASY